MTIEYAMYRGDEFIDIGTIDANNLYCLVGIDRNAGDVEVYDSPSIEDLLKEINVYGHVEKVNAHLVVED